RVLLERRRDDVEQSAVSLDRDALRIELQAAQAAQLLSATRVSGTAVDELRQHRAGSQGLAGDLLTADVDATVIRRDREDDVAQELAIVAVDGAHETASTALNEIRGKPR